MKTKEQVQDHLMNNAYPKDVINKIMGYIVAKGVKESDERVFHKTKTNGAWHTFDEFVEWFEDDIEDEIDLIENEFYYIIMSDGAETIIQYKASNNNVIMSSYCYSPNRSKYQLGIIGTYSVEHIKSFRTSTPEEKQQFISAVEKEFNKTWNGKEWIDCVEYLDERYETYFHKHGCGLSLLFNDNKQALSFEKDGGIFCITPANKWIIYADKVKCKLVEVKTNDLKAGDFFYSKTFDGIYLYDGEKVIKPSNLSISELWGAKVYKLVPIL